ncbi:unnamed protein product [Rotaria sp. Silwood1]|nr:unnamed protein product [Rotaria sp. Silwood1]
MSSRTRSVQPQGEFEHESWEKFYQLNINYRVCRSFCPKPDDQETCECNQRKAFHTDLTGKKENKWKISSHTEQKFNDRYFGTLFNDASYVRLDIETQLTTVTKLLFEVWKIPEPKLIMSIIGGAKYFKLNDRLESNVIKGIMNVACKSNVWMITTGYNVGIVQLLGQAIGKVKLKYPNQKITAIGIGKWGSIKDVQKLTGKNGKKPQKGKIPIEHSDNEEAPDKLRKGESDLEKNHSHYLMLDDGRYRHFDTRDFRTRLCEHMANLDKKNGFHTPVVTIVVDGGSDTMANIYYDLKHNIPVVIINGSGRIADFLSRWLLYTKNFENDSEHGKVAYGIYELKTKDVTQKVSKNRKTPKSRNRTDIHAELHVDPSETKLCNLFTKYEKELKNDLESVLSPDNDSHKKNSSKSGTSNNHSDKNLERTLNQVMYCLQPAVRSQITVFNLHSETNLSETIFESICKSFESSSKDSTKEQNKHTPFLDLAMEWNCIHVAKAFVFQNSLDNISDPEKAFLTALKQDLPTFVYEFLKLGIQPAKIFFPSNQFFLIEGNRYATFIQELYNDNNDYMATDKTHFKYFIEHRGVVGNKNIDSVDSLNRVLENLIGDYMHKLYFETDEHEEKDRIKWGLMRSSKQSKKDKNKDIENIKYSSTELKKQQPDRYIMRDLFLWAVLMNRIDMAKVFLSQLKYRICPALIATKILKQYYSIAHHGELKTGYGDNLNYFEKYAIDCLNKCDHNAERACELVVQQNELYGYVSCLQIASDAHDKSFIAEPACIQGMNNIWLEPFGINYSDPYPLEYPRYFELTPTLNTYIHRFEHFHLSPMIKFCYHLTAHFFFLLLFSYVLLFNFSPPKAQSPSIHWTEILTIILVSCMLIDEFHYFFTQDNLTFSGKLKHSFRDFFKSLTTLAIILFYIGLILRFTHADSEEKFVVARVIMAYDIELWWLRCLSFIIVVPYLGPHLVAIWKMIQDLLFFMVIIAVVMIGYGVASRSMVYYPRANNFTMETGGSIDNSFDGRSVFRHIAYPVYYLLHGEVGDERTSLDSNPDAAWSISNHILLAIHMLFVNILLTNLLIAMFSKRFDEVYEDIQNIWQSQKYLFTREYFTRSPFLPPINLIYDIYYLSRMFVFFIRRTFFDQPGDHHAKVFKMIAKNKPLLEEWREFEGAATYQYAHDQVKALKDASTRLSEGSDSSSRKKKEDPMNKDNVLSDTMDNIKEVQENIKNLSSTLDGMRPRIMNLIS